MASRECPTCCEEYDSREHRILILYCGHSQCKACMQAQFVNRQITCAACRKSHRYPEFSSIPVCYVAEKIWEDVDKTKIQESILDEKEAIPQAPTLHRGICVEHGAFKLFWCNTHQEWICTHCSVIDHPRGDCDIIRIRKKLENDKDLIELNISEELILLDNTKKDIAYSINELEKQSKKENDKIKSMEEEMDKIKMSISQTEKNVATLIAQKSTLEIISIECTENKSTLENIITRLHDVRNFKEMDAESGKSVSMINIHKIWRKEFKENFISVPNETKLLDILGKLKKETNTLQKNTMIQEAKKILQEIVKRSKMYATKTIGNVKRFSLIEQKEGCIHLNDLQNNLSPNSNAMILEFDDVMALVPNQPVVFITLNHRGNTLCCLHIRLNIGQSRFAQQFLEISTSSSGHGSYRNATFGILDAKGQPAERVRCSGYINNSGELEYKSLFKLEKLTGGAPWDEGTVYGINSEQAGFAICTRTQRNSKTATYLSFGRLISGLPELKVAVEKHDVKDIVFSACGVVIDSSL